MPSLQKWLPHVKWPCPNVSTTPLRQWGFQQCLPFSWTTLRGKHCRHPIEVMGVVDTFGPCSVLISLNLATGTCVFASNSLVWLRVFGNSVVLACTQTWLFKTIPNALYFSDRKKTLQDCRWPKVGRGGISFSVSLVFSHLAILLHKLASVLYYVNRSVFCQTT